MRSTETLTLTWREPTMEQKPQGMPQRTGTLTTPSWPRYYGTPSSPPDEEDAGQMVAPEKVVEQIKSLIKRD